MPDWLKNLLSYMFMPATSILTNITGNPLPYYQIFEDQGSPNFSGAVASSSGLGPVITDYPGNEEASGAGLPMEVNTTDTGVVDTDIADALEGAPSVSDYIGSHPEASAEDIMKFMSSNSDEWAQKYIDYMLEKQSIDEQNAYTASREDTAYQRLTQDLIKAGLNPAMIYGGHANISAGGSTGTVKLSGDPVSSSISNFEKLKRLLLLYMTFQVSSALGLTNSAGKGLSSLLSLFK